MSDAATQLRLQVTKADDEQRLVFGFLSVPTARDGTPVVDLQGDVIRPATLEKAVYRYVLDFRQAGDVHKVLGVGRLVESVVFTKDKLAKMGIPAGTIPEGAWWAGYYVEDPATWDRIKTENYQGLSIGGSGRRIPWVEAA